MHLKLKTLAFLLHKNDKNWLKSSKQRKKSFSNFTCINDVLPILCWLPKWENQYIKRKCLWEWNLNCPITHALLYFFDQNCCLKKPSFEPFWLVNEPKTGFSNKISVLSWMTTKESFLNLEIFTKDAHNFFLNILLLFFLLRPFLY